jgi:pimeloyl-ACP methyl ester carboxylesterase
MTSNSPMDLAFTKLGHGPTPLLAFHGIGQNGRSCFEAFAPSVGKHYTVYAFDLPFHGSNADFPFQPVSKAFLKKAIIKFLAQENIQHFDVVGFSMGGRFAIGTLEAFADRIDRLYLIAPDGITENPLFNLATRYSVPRSVFRWSMQHPAPFFNAIKVLEKVGLLNKSIVRFTEQVLDTPEKRNSLYKSWIAFSSLWFDIPLLYHLAMENKVIVTLFTGKYDKLLKPEHAAPLADLLPENQNIILKSGHAQLVEQASTWISAYLTKLSDTES